MASNTKKVYKIKDKRTGKYITLGYSNKKTWLIFPAQAIEFNQHKIHDKENYEVEQYELVKTKTFDLDGNEIK
jgi:hypothetical protein